jgi:glycogen synthase
VKILLSSFAFSPSIGGIESCSLALAVAFSRLGHEVQILTHTLSDDLQADHGLKVIRRPSMAAMFQALNWCEVYLQNNISLQTAWPLVFVRKPWVVCTQTWLKNPDGSVGMSGYLKKLALRFATNVYISHAINRHVGYEGFTVPNPYDDKTFQLVPQIKRERSLVFLGRLVSDKGCDLLIKSLAILKDAGMALPLTIIGAGPEEQPLKKLIAELKLDKLVQFAGALKGEALAGELNRHQILVVPSRWEEPFGIVALEGIACGCLVVGSSGGGLPDAIGPCGMTFKNGDAVDLSQAIQKILEKRETIQKDQGAVMADHLDRHRIEVIASRYVKIFEQLCHTQHNGKIFFPRK